MSLRLLVLLAVLFGGCIQQVKLPVIRQQMTPVPPVWRTVALQQIRGTRQTTVSPHPNVEFLLEQPPTMVLRDTLLDRLGSDGQRPVSLYVDKLGYAIKIDGSFGVSAEFILSKGDKTKSLALEHSVTLPTGVRGVGASELREAVYTRAIVDLTDRLIYHKEVLAFLDAQATEAKDSALLADVDVGPMGDVKPSIQGRDATGRIMWGSAETQIDGQASILLGESKGGFAGMFVRRSSRHYGLRVGVTMGGFKAGDRGLFAYTTHFGFEMGYRRTRYTDNGYVDYPGISILIVPQVMTMQALASGMVSTMIMGGGSIELDIPLHRYFGLSGGFWMGSGYFTATSEGNSISNDLGFRYFPAGDLYIQTSTSRISIGLAFQQLASGGEASDIWENPMINLTYRSLAGRGIAYSRSKITAGDYDLHEEEVELTQPKNVFSELRIKRVNAPPASPLRITPTPARRPVPTTTPAPGVTPLPGTAPVPAPGPEQNEWYYAVGKQRLGPVTISFIKHLFADGQIGNATLVWKKDMTQWTPLKDVPELAPSAKQPGPQIWYYAVGQKKRGPVDEYEIRKLFGAGKITGDSLVWKPGMPQWTKLADVPEFAGLK
jgi:hypothetical protein